MRPRLRRSTTKASPIVSPRSRRSRASAEQIAEWFSGRQLVIVAEIEERGLVAFAASFPYSARACYAGIGEFSVYVTREYRGRGGGRAVLAALIEAATAAGLHKLTSRVFPENIASRALLKGWVSRKSEPIAAMDDWMASGATA
jgi:L-amino acid N-acyltransferase YncA